MNKIVLGALTGGVLVPMAAITLFTSVIVLAINLWGIHSILLAYHKWHGNIRQANSSCHSKCAWSGSRGNYRRHGLHRKHSDSSGCFGHCRTFAWGSRCQLGCPDAAKGTSVLGSALSCWIRLLD